MESYLYGMAPIIVNFFKCIFNKKWIFFCASGRWRRYQKSTEKYGEVRKQWRYQAVSSVFFSCSGVKIFFSLQCIVAHTGEVIAFQSVQIRTNPYSKVIAPT